MLEIALVVCFSAGVAQAAEAPFAGKWKLDPSRTRLPDAMKIESKGGNTYAFDFGGGGVETIVVDGTDQKGLDGTLLSVKPDGPNTWIVERKRDGKRQIRATWKLSKDGRTITDYFRQVAPDGAPISMDYVYQRTGKGSGIAADWRSIKETMNSPLVLQVTPLPGDGLSFATSPAFFARTVRFGRTDYPDEGPTPRKGATTSVRTVDARTFVVTRKYDGKVVATEDIGLSSDLKTLTIAQHITGRDKPNLYVFARG